MTSNHTWWTTHLDLMRYLFVWRARGPVVRFDAPPAMDIAYSLGAQIAGTLPPKQAQAWRESLPNLGHMMANASTADTELVENPWPLSAVIFVYPVKRLYGRDELILWELKLMGGSADHALFLETILPSLEAMSSTTLSRHQSGYRIWGKFDIQSVYVARGNNWIPLVQQGKLDLRRRFSTQSWCKELNFHQRHRSSLGRLQWVSPFQWLPNDPQGVRKTHPPQPPSLKEILEAWISRASQLILGRWGNPQKLLDAMDAPLRQDWEEALEIASRIPILRTEPEAVPKIWKDMWQGQQIFAASIPESMIPYLYLAALFHVGRYTSYGCGAFGLN